MIRLLTIIGARPQIIKAAAISRAIKAHNEGLPDERIEEHILHTGQHYDANMSEVFFRELGIPEPDYNLHVGSGSHGVQTARIIEGIEAVLNAPIVDCRLEIGDCRLEIGDCRLEIGDFKYDGVIVYGDTNSTLAAAVAASKMHVPVFHVEAGLRSFNMGMPEEINRIVCDQLSSVLFTPTLTGMRNLREEGFPIGDWRLEIDDLGSQIADCRLQIDDLGSQINGANDENDANDAIKSRVRFADGRGQKVVLSGDVMYDNSMYFSGIADVQSDIIERLGLSSRKFVLATIHRPANTDNAENLRSIFRALNDIAEQHQMDVVLPLHPRTRKMIGDWKLEIGNRRLKVIEPASFFEIIRLEKNAAIVMTDSGGVQKEAFFYGTPCVILRPETEWVEIVEAGAGIIADADYTRIMAAYEQLVNKPVQFPALFGDGHASEKIIREIIRYLGEE